MRSTATAILTMLQLLTLFLSTLALTRGTSLSISRMSDGKSYPEPCAVICSGVGNHWLPSNNYPGRLYMKVDTRSCNFVSPPIVTATVSLPLYSNLVNGGVAIKQLYQTSFYAYVQGDIDEADKGWELMWSATGFNCQWDSCSSRNLSSLLVFLYLLQCV